MQFYYVDQNMNTNKLQISSDFIRLLIPLKMKVDYITETSPYKSDPRFAPNIYKNGGNLGSESK